MERFRTNALAESVNSILGRVPDDENVTLALFRIIGVTSVLHLTEIARVVEGVSRDHVYDNGASRS